MLLEDLSGQSLELLVRNLPFLACATSLSRRLQHHEVPNALAFLAGQLLDLFDDFGGAHADNLVPPLRGSKVAGNRSGARHGGRWRAPSRLRFEWAGAQGARCTGIAARAYGLTRDELRYIRDPTDVHGPDSPGETFRVLKEKETAKFGEYRTHRLVLEAWDAWERRGDAENVREGETERGCVRSTSRSMGRGGGVVELA